jgi:hypothetical protein
MHECSLADVVLPSQIEDAAGAVKDVATDAAREVKAAV